MAIVGSCCTRDAFNSLFVPDYKEHFVLCYQAFQQPLASLMEPPISIPLAANSFAEGQEHGYHAWMVLRPDIDKRALQMLAFHQPDIIVFDFYADTINGIRTLNESVIGGNKIFTKTELLPDFASGEVFLPIYDIPLYAKLFRAAARRFATFQQTFLPNTQLVVNQARLRNRYVDSTTGNPARHGNHTDAWLVLHNRIWRKLDSIFMEETGAAAIAHSKLTLNPRYRFGGPGYVHYTDDAYRHLSSELRQIASSRHPSDGKTKREILGNSANCVANPSFSSQGAGWTFEGSGRVSLADHAATLAARKMNSASTLLLSDPIELPEKHAELTFSFDFREDAGSFSDNTTPIVEIMSFPRTRIPLEQASVSIPLNFAMLAKDETKSANAGWRTLSANIQVSGPWVRLVFHSISDIAYSITNVSLARRDSLDSHSLDIGCMAEHWALPPLKPYSRRRLTAAVLRRTKTFHLLLQHAVPRFSHQIQGITSSRGATA